MKLTLYEHKIISLRLQDLEYKEIAYELGIAICTVRNNFQYIYKKLQPFGRCSNKYDLREAYAKYVYERRINLEDLEKLTRNV